MYQKLVALILALFVVIAFIIVIGNEGEIKDEVMVQPAVVSPEPMGAPVMEEEKEVRSEVLPQGKIDVRVACESALMYTTFTDGVAAEAYVAECIEGKHPEVIERYISDMGVDGATI